jgi:hypothetical protein
MKGRVPAAVTLDGLGELRQPGERRVVAFSAGEQGGEPGVFVERGLERRLGHFEFAGDGGAFGEGGLLREPFDARAPLHLEHAAVCFERAREHLHEGRLTGAVEADQPDALLRLDHELDLVEERTAPEGDGDVGGAQQSHGRAPTAPRPRAHLPRVGLRIP